MQNTLFGLGCGDRKKDTATDPMWKQGYRKGITSSHTMLAYVVNINNLITKYIICTVLRDMTSNDC